MVFATKPNVTVGLDVEAGSIAAAEVSQNGKTSVTRYGVAELEPGAFREGEVADVDALGAAIKKLFADNKLSKSVRIGVANQRVAVRSMRLPKIDDRGELETAIRFQAQDHIPMPLEQAVLDWQVVGTSLGPAGKPQLEIVAVAGRRDMLSGVVAAARKAGLRPVGIDHSAFGMIRALSREEHPGVGAGTFVEAPAPQVPSYEERIAMGQTSHEAGLPSTAKLYCNFADVTNLAVARGSACLFARISPFGMEGIAQKLAERRGLNLEHARQWLVHTGLEAPVESIEGDPENVSAARDALAEGAAKLADELRLSLEYYAAQDGALPVDGVVACGPGTTVPGLLERLQRDVGQRFESGRPMALAHLDDGVAARLTLSYGLALEE
jgi:type IV pilus assembly protein PilM